MEAIGIIISTVKWWEKQERDSPFMPKMGI